MSPAEQRASALRLGNAIRLAGAAVRRELDGLSFDESRQRAAEYLLDPPDSVLSIRLGHFLSACHYFGPAKVTRVVRAAEIAPSFITQPVRRLTADQRTRLAAALQGVGA